MHKSAIFNLRKRSTVWTVFFSIIFRSFHSLRLIFDDLATGCCIGSFPLKVKFFCLMFMREIFNRIWFSTKYESFHICPFQMVCVKGSKAPGKKSTRNLEVVFKKGSCPVMESSFLYRCCVCCRRFIFVLLTNWLSLACPICAGQWKKGRTGKTNCCNHKAFWIESHAVFFSEEVVFIKKIVVWFPH